MQYDPRWPSIAALKRRARRRLPKFAFDYLDGGIDGEHCKRRNRAAWHAVQLTPRYLRDVTAVDLTAKLFGYTYSQPVGIAPVGLGGMLWPRAESILAAAAARANIPYTLSTFSTTPLEYIAELAPGVAWFQLYVPREISVMKDLLARVARAGFAVLVVTVDIPVGAKRNRELKNGLRLPFQLTPTMLWQGLTHPRWTAATLTHGAPDFVNVAKYRRDAGRSLADFITDFNIRGVTCERLKLIRRLWDRPLVIKGLQHMEDIRAAADLGADGVIISNHGGRQLDAAPSSADCLAAVPDELRARLTIMADGGIRTGADVTRAHALGARLAFCGRGFYWGVGALGSRGGRQVIEIFRDEITRTLRQIGAASIAEVDRRWLTDSAPAENFTVA